MADSKEVMESMFSRQVDMYNFAMGKVSPDTVIDSRVKVAGIKIGYSINEEGEYSFYQMDKDSNSQLDLSSDQTEDLKEYLAEGNAYSRFSQNKKKIDGIDYSNVTKTNTKAPATKGEFIDALNSDFLKDKSKELKAKKASIEEILEGAVQAKGSQASELPTPPPEAPSSATENVDVLYGDLKNAALNRGSTGLAMKSDGSLLSDQSEAFEAGSIKDGYVSANFSRDRINYKKVRQDSVKSQTSISPDTIGQENYDNVLQQFAEVKALDEANEINADINATDFDQAKFDQYRSNFGRDFLPEKLEDARELLNTQLPEIEKRAQETAVELSQTLDDMKLYANKSRDHNNAAEKIANAGPISITQRNSQFDISLADGESISYSGNPVGKDTLDRKSYYYTHTVEGEEKTTKLEFSETDKKDKRGFHEEMSPISKFESINEFKQKITAEEYTEEQYSADYGRNDIYPNSLQDAKDAMNSPAFDVMHLEAEEAEVKVQQIAREKLGLATEKEQENEEGKVSSLNDIYADIQKDSRAFEGGRGIVFDGENEPDVYLIKGIHERTGESKYTYNYLDEEDKPLNAIVALAGDDQAENKAKVDELIADIAATRVLNDYRSIINDEDLTEQAYDNFRTKNPQLNLPDNLEAAREVFSDEAFTDIDKKDLENREELHDLVKSRTQLQNKEEDKEIPELSGGLRAIIEQDTQNIAKTSDSLEVELAGIRGFNSISAEKGKDGNFKFTYDRGPKDKGELKLGDPMGMVDKMAKDRAILELRNIKRDYYSRDEMIPDKKYMQMREENNFLPKDQNNLKDMLNSKEFGDMFELKGELITNKKSIAKEASKASFKENIKDGKLTKAQMIGIGAAGVGLIAVDAVISGIMGHPPHIMQAVSGIVNLYVNYQQSQQINDLRGKQNAEDALKEIRRDFAALKGQTPEGGVDQSVEMLKKMGLDPKMLEAMVGKAKEESKEQKGAPPTEVLAGTEAKLEKDKAPTIEAGRTAAA